LPTCGGNACLSMFIDFDMGSFLVGQILESRVMGQTPKSQSIEVQNPSKSPFSNVDLCEKVMSEMEVQTSFPLNVHIYHMHMFMNSWKVNEVICIS
jgi:hypothetical protein